MSNTWKQSWEAHCCCVKAEHGVWQGLVPVDAITVDPVHVLCVRIRSRNGGGLLAVADGQASEQTSDGTGQPGWLLTIQHLVDTAQLIVTDGPSTPIMQGSKAAHIAWPAPHCVCKVYRPPSGNTLCHVLLNIKGFLWDDIFFHIDIQSSDAAP